MAQVGAMRSETVELGAMVCTCHLVPAGFDSAPFYRGRPDDTELIEFTDAEQYRRKTQMLAHSS